MGDPLAAPALGLKISLAFMRRLFVEGGVLSRISFIRSILWSKVIGFTCHFRRARGMVRLLVFGLWPLVAAVAAGNRRRSSKRQRER